MALILPQPESANEVKADALIRQIETTTPIVRGGAAWPWVSAIMRARERPDTGLDVAVCAMRRILLALPEPNRSVRWAYLAFVADTPIGVFTGPFTTLGIHVLVQMQNLHAFATAPDGYTGPQLQAKARELGNPFLNPRDSTQALTLAQLNAFRAGYAVWRALIG